MKKPKLDEIADRIHAHLKRFEADPKINASDPTYKTRPYYYANACRTGAYVCIKYVSYQCSWSLKRDVAECYLAWLDAGNVGAHYEMERLESAGRAK